MIQLTFTAKEIEIIGMMAPPLTAQEVCQKVMDDWLKSNIGRMHENAKTLTQKIDEVIADNATKVDKPVVK
jgi:hypothetical protein